MTDAEFLIAVEVLSKPTGKWGGSLEVAAVKISDLRCGSVVTPSVRAWRTVSGRWVLNQLAKRGIPGKRAIHAKMEDGSLFSSSVQNAFHTEGTGPRMGYVGDSEAENDSKPLSALPEAISAASQTAQVSIPQPEASP